MATGFIVEDEQSLLKLYKMVLESHGYYIKATANNGAKALEKYKNFQEKPDFVIMDHRMPVKSGLETAKEILQLNPDAKIILATADKSVKDQAEKVGIISFKGKPFNNEHLIENVKKALQNK